MDVWFELEGSTFTWNAEKARSNLDKHGVRFEDAAAVFFDPLFVLVDAARDAEARDAVIGFDRVARLLFVVHLQTQADCIRLVSARRATPAEESIYAD